MQVFFTFYTQNSDGTWNAHGKIYKSKIELKGTLPSSDEEVIYLVLTNDDSITFDEVSKSYYSSDSNDQLDPDVACVVQIIIK